MRIKENELLDYMLEFEEKFIEPKCNISFRITDDALNITNVRDLLNYLMTNADMENLKIDADIYKGQININFI